MRLKAPMADKTWTGNVGEWGELYAACKLLGTGLLSIAEHAKPYQIIELTRPERHGQTTFVVDRTKVTDTHNGIEHLLVEYVEAARIIKNAIEKKPSSNRSIQISPESQRYIASLGFTKLSAGSAHNSDIHIDVRSQLNELERLPLKGYSIKTEAGSAPTLYNMSSGRHLHYSVSAQASALRDLASVLSAGGRGRKKAFTKFADTAPSINPGTTSNPQIVGSMQFAANLRSLDGDAPQLLALAVLEYYFFGARRCSDAVAAVAKNNPLGNLTLEAYQLKYSRIWREFALGLPGATIHRETQPNQGGILRVKTDMSIEAVPAVTDRGGNLLSATEFDAPSFNRWLRNAGLSALTITGTTTAVLTLPWQIRWAKSA